MENQKKIRQKEIIKKKVVRKSTYLERYRHLEQYLISAGLKTTKEEVFRKIVITTSIIVPLIALFLIYYAYTKHTLSIIYVSIVMLTVFSLGYVLVYFLCWLFFLAYLDYKSYKRRTEIEKVLPEFFRLVASNHRTGIPLDQSIWRSNKPRFGALYEDINEIAKTMYAKGDFVEALRTLGTKYDSKILKRAISNLAEGIKGGADVCSLLDDIANDITNIQIIRKNLAADVQHYIMFTTMATLVIAPIMYAISANLIGVIYMIKTQLTGSMAGSNMPMFEGLTKATKGSADFFFKFSILMIITNAIFSNLMSSSIKYGNIRQDIIKIPFYIVIALLLFLVFKYLISFITPEIGN